MAEQQQELELADKGGKSKKMLFIIIAVVVLLAGGGAAAFFLMGSSEEAPAAAEGATAPAAADTAPAATGREAFYVAMPRPFLFNVAGTVRSRLVEIKVQLMVRGEDNEVTLKKHIPLIEDALLTTFSAASEEKLSTQAGKDELRQVALLNVQNTLQPITGRKVVEKVLFTGFVMQ